MAKPDPVAPATPEPSPAATPPRHMIHAAMLAAARQAEREGIAKEKKEGSEVKYPYRGIDAVLNTFSAIFAAAGLTYAQRFSNMQRILPNTEKGQKQTGGVITLVECEVTFYAEDGSSRTVGPFIGEAFDSMDKSASKAQSVALRNCLLHTFCVPLGPGYDPEESGETGEDPTPQAQRTPPPREDPGLPPGLFLGEGQKKWLEAKLAAQGRTIEGALKHYKRIDKNNAVDVPEEEW